MPAREKPQQAQTSGVATDGGEDPGQGPLVPSPAVLILNPTAARGRAAATWKRLARELGAWRRKPEIVETTHAGHGTELARQAVADGAGLVIAAGGDGTAHEVVQGLMEVDAPSAGTAFAHLPLGTGCDLARGLGLPLDPSGMLRRLRKGRHAHVDIGVADLSRNGETVRRYFLNGASIGLGPAVALRVRESSLLKRLGKHSYTVASVQQLFSGRPYQVSWHADGGSRVEQLVLQMFINNGPSVAGGMRPSPEAAFDSGSLHVLVAGALSLTAALSQFRRLDRGLPLTHPEIRSFSCRTIDLEGAGLDVETDGEVVAGLPARLWVRPSGLLVRLPAPERRPKG